MREEWRPVVGYEGLYEVSNMGNVKSLERMKWNGRGYHKIPERILKASKSSNDYLFVSLWKDGKRKQHRVHRLVAQAFIQFVPQEGVMYDVDHRNTDRTDNRAINLYWVSRSQNMNNPITNSKLSKPVIAIEKRTGLKLEFSSAHEAERETGIANSNIIKCCKGKINSCGGFYWMYVDSDAE